MRVQKDALDAQRREKERKKRKRKCKLKRKGKRKGKEKRMPQTNRTIAGDERNARVNAPF